MTEWKNRPLERRRFLATGVATAALVALSGCATIERWSYIDAIRRLLERATQNAFARLTAQDGFWNSAVARLDLSGVFGNRGGVVESILLSAVFRDKLQHRLNRVAEDGARRAAPLVADAVKAIGPENAIAIIKGGPKAATDMLQGQMGTALVSAMVPALGDAMRIANDPIIGQAISALTGIGISDVAQSLAVEADKAIWAEIAAAEAEIRADPESTGDPVLIAALKAG